jgi:hypothetical protein
MLFSNVGSTIVVVYCFGVCSASWTHDDRGFFYSRYPTPASHDAGVGPADARGTETDALQHHKVFSI